MAERGVRVDHATLNRWVTKYSPLEVARAVEEVYDTEILAHGRNLPVWPRKVDVFLLSGRQCGKHP